MWYIRLRIKFQSTRPLRGATVTANADERVYGISIHAPLAGRDLAAVAGWIKKKIFQSTRPLRGATYRAYYKVLAQMVISIHAPLAGRDKWRQK